MKPAEILTWTPPSRGSRSKGGYFPGKIAGKYSWAAIFALPYLSLDAAEVESNTGLGDPGLGLAFWPYANEELGLHVSLWMTTYFPLGAYKQGVPETSPGIDAFTYLPSLEVGWYRGRFAFDGILEYWIYTESDKLKIDLEDALEMDLVFTYSATDNFLVSLHANVWQETEDLKENGVAIPDTKGYRYGLGPKLSYIISENTMLNLTWVHDLDAKNQLEGDWIYARIARGF